MLFTSSHRLYGILLTLMGGLLPQAGAEPSVSFELSSPSRVSLAVYDKGGRMVRELRRAEPFAAGRHQVLWDGRDGQGDPLPAGDYEWRLLETQGLTAKYLTTLGVNPDWKNTPPDAWVKHWIGDHVGVGSVQVDPEGNVYLASWMTETLHMTMKMSAKGERVWSQSQYYQGGRSNDSSLSRNRFLVLQPAGKLRVLDAGGGALLQTIDVNWEGVAPSRMDADDQYIYLVYPERGAVRALSAENFAPVAASENISGAGLVAALSNGRAWVVDAEGGLWMFSVENGVANQVRNDLQTVMAMAVSPTTGRLVVVLRQETETRVVEVIPDSEIRSLFGGKTRGSGTHDAGRLGDVWDIAVGPDGDLWVTEIGPVRRVARYAPDGTCKREWFGGHSFYINVQPDPRDPTRIFGPSVEGWINAWRIDYDSGETRLEGAWSVGGLLDGLFPFHYGEYRPVYFNDQLYFLFGSIPALLRFDEKTDRMVPVALTGHVETGMYRLNYGFPGGSGPYGFPKPWADAVQAKGNEDVRTVSRYFSWFDTNGNTQLDAEELSIEEDPGVPLYSPGTLLPNGDMVFPASLADFHTWRIRNVSDTGVPHWSWSTVEKGDPIPEHLQLFGGMRLLSSDEAGNIYGSLQLGVLVLEHGQTHGGAWPWRAITGARVMKWSADGDPLFEIGRQTKDPSEAKTGKLFYPMAVFPGPHDTLWVNDQAVQPAMVYTRDGLFAGTVFDHRTEDGLPEPVYQVQGDDNQGGAVVELQDGRVFYFSPYIGFMPVYEITGWEGLQRQSGSLTLETQAESLMANGTGLTGRYFESDEAEKPVLERLDPEMRFDWGPSAPVEGLPRNRFRVEWEGSILIPVTDEYTFEIWKDRDGIAFLKIGDQTVIDSDVGEIEKGSVFLKAGKHPIHIRYQDRIGDASFRLFWWGRNLDKGQVPTQNLFF